MSIALVIFYILSAAILGCGILAVTSAKIFRAAVYLLFSLIGIAGLFFLLENDFIAAVQIVVYVGGIVVLIIFSIFLTHKSGEEMKMPSTQRKIAGFVVTLIGFTIAHTLIYNNNFIANTNGKLEQNVANIGAQMLDINKHGFVLPFEVVSMLLLAAMIGAIVIAMKVKPKE
jgi:NADH-quinone oxidoreductase subunit J